MPNADASASARVERTGTSLRFAGALTRAHVADAWRRACKQLDGIDAFDLSAVDRVDSAGVALLAELATRAGGAVAIAGNPPGLADLRGAYRLTPSLAFAA